MEKDLSTPNSPRTAILFSTLILGSFASTQEAAAVLQTDVEELSRLLDGSRPVTREWLNAATASGYTRLERLKALPAWESSGKALMKALPWRKAADPQSLGGILAAILDDAFPTRVRAAKALGANPVVLNRFIHNHGITRSWFENSRKGRRPRLEILRECKSWEQHGATFMEYYAKLGSRKNKPYKIIDRETPGGVIGLILDTGYATRATAAETLKISRSMVSHCINGRYHVSFNWLNKPGKDGRRRIDILKACPGWAKHAADFERHYKELSLPRKHGVKTAAEKIEENDWKKAVGETVRHIRVYSGDSSDDLQEDTSLAQCTRKALAWLEKIEAGSTRVGVKAYHAAAAAICEVYCLAENDGLKANGGIKPEARELNKAYRRLCQLVPSVRQACGPA